jgi:putative transposase
MTCDAVSSCTKIKKVGRQLSPEQVGCGGDGGPGARAGPGPGGLLKLFTKSALETALNEEMTEHLGYEKNGAGRDRESANIRNGSRPKTVISDAVGEVEIAVPRDREGTFSPAIVKKRQRRLGDVDKIVLSLYAKGLTTGEISAHFHEIYGASASKETVSRITDAVIAA